MRKYTIMPATGPVDLTGDVDSPQWSRANELSIDLFPWHTAGEKQATTARILYDSEAIYLQFTCEDKHISADVTELNGNVCRDSCVEFFASYSPEKYPDYFNIEVNCCGCILVGHGPARRPRTSIDAETAKLIDVVTSVPGPTKQPESGDDGWWAAIRLPFEAVSIVAEREIPRPAAGTRWLANCYRCGGSIDSQHAMWAEIDTEKFPRPDFHQPGEFAEMIFA